MKPFGKRGAMAVLCAAILTSPLLLSGCSMSELWQGTEQSRKEIAQRSEQDQVSICESCKSIQSHGCHV